MTGQLVPIGGRSAPTIAVARPVTLVGRHPECDVRIDSPQVSRRHCCLAMAYDRTLIRDLGSRNGVRVNGRLVEEVRLQPGDEVAIAQFLYRFDALPNSTPMPIRKVAPEPVIDLDDDFIPIDD